MESRFPLFGGWKTQFYQGYSVPVQELLTVGKVRAGVVHGWVGVAGWLAGWMDGWMVAAPHRHSNHSNQSSPLPHPHHPQGERYTLTVPFSVPFSEVWVSDLTYKVILPEWARDVQVHVPFDVEQVRGVAWRGVAWRGVAGWAFSRLVG